MFHFRQTLEQESATWTAEGLISAETRETLLARYEESRGIDLRSWGLLTLWSLGAFLLGLAGLLVVSHNWENLSGACKLSIVLGTMGGVYAVALGLERTRRTTLSEVAFFFGTILFGVGIWQAAQVYHVQAHYPDGIWMWAVGTLLLAIGTRTSVVHLLAAALLILWEYSEISLFNPWDSFSAAWSLPFLAALGFFSTHWSAKSPLVRETIHLLYAVTFLVWILLFPHAWRVTRAMSFFYMIWGVILYLLPEMLENRSPTAKLCRIFGLLMAAFALIPGSTENFSENCHFPGGFLFVEIATELFFLGLVVAYVCLRNDWQFLRRNAFLLLLGVYSLLAAVVCRYSQLNFMLFQNAVMVTFALAFLCWGMRRVQLSAFVFGIAYFLLWTILRYFDLFGDFGMLGTATLFAFCALVLFGFSWYWMGLEKTPRPASENLPKPLSMAGVATGFPMKYAVTVILLQFVTLFSMIEHYGEPARNGQEIVVLTEPVDPRALFRGEYVTLQYAFNQMPPSGRTLWNNDLWNNERRVYAVLLPPAKGEHVWKFDKLTTQRPTDGVYLAGWIKGWRVRFGIEQFFKQEGTAKEIELASRGANGKRLEVTLGVLPDGRAAVKRVALTP